MRIKRIVVLLLFLNLTSCNAQEEREIKLRIKNNSNKTMDSIRLHFFNERTKYYNIKKNDELNLIFKIKTDLIPKGERGVFSICVFEGEYFFDTSAGFVGFPTAKLEDNYSFYIYDDYVTIKKDYKPHHLLEKHKISEYRDSEN